MEIPGFSESQHLVPTVETANLFNFTPSALEAFAANSRREHLHLVRYFSRSGNAVVRPNYGPILRQRRLQLARSFAAKDYEINPVLLSYALPKGPSGFWLDELCPWGGPSRRAASCADMARSVWGRYKFLISGKAFVLMPGIACR